MYNGKLTRRWNGFLREKVIIPRLRKALLNKDFTLISNNCTGGFILHDLGLQFKTPTINLYFPELDYFKFLENFEEYMSIELEENMNDTDECPCGILRGAGNVRVRFAHYKSFEEAKQKWDERKERINYEKLFVIWTYAFMDSDDELYERFERLPFKNKIAFINKDISDKFPSHVYIKGFEERSGTGQIAEFENLLGKRYYDQFDWIKWFNEN